MARGRVLNAATRGNARYPDARFPGLAGRGVDAAAEWMKTSVRQQCPGHIADRLSAPTDTRRDVPRPELQKNGDPPYLDQIDKQPQHAGGSDPDRDTAENLSRWTTCTDGP